MFGSVDAMEAPVSMRVSFAPTSVSEVRGRLAEWMAQAGARVEAVEDAKVVASELVGNAVRHAQPIAQDHILVEWRMEDRGVELAVSDGGSPTRPRRVHATATALSGRGMTIVDQLAVAWWADREPTQSTVHAVLSL